MVSEKFTLAMFIISPIVLIIDAIIVASGIFRRFAKKEKEDEEERTKLFSIVDLLEKIGIGFGFLTLLLAGYLAVVLPAALSQLTWLVWFNPITIIFLCAINYFSNDRWR